MLNLLNVLLEDVVTLLGSLLNQPLLLLLSLLNVVDLLLDDPMLGLCEDEVARRQAKFVVGWTCVTAA